MIVCLCHRISDRAIAEAARAGCTDFEMLQEDTCIARNCGCCEATAREVFAEHCAVVQIHRLAAPQPADGTQPLLSGA